MKTRTVALLPLLLGLLVGLRLSGFTDPAADLTIEIADPVIVHGAGSRIFQGGPLLSLSDGSLLLGGLEQSLRSTDQGKTWITQPPLSVSSGWTLQLRDGSFYVLGGPSRPSGKPGVFLLKRFRLRSLTELHSQAPPAGDDIPVTLQQWTSATGDDGKTVEAAPHLGGRMLELADGTLLLVTYGNFVGDRVPIEGFVPTKGENWFKYRTYLMASTDQGASWNYRSTIAYDAKTGQESFCEPGLADLGNGELLVVMRTGRYAPMYQARSKDGGKTWGKPESLHTLGLEPKLALLPNGVLVCSFGWRPLKIQPGVGQPYAEALQDYQKRYRSDVGIEDPSAAAGGYVMFSLDKGRTWNKPRRIARPITVGYTWLAPSGADSCVVFSQRIVLPGESEAILAYKWEKEWDFEKARRVLEARRITVKVQHAL